jgi:hypothetical protein
MTSQTAEPDSDQRADSREPLRPSDVAEERNQSVFHQIRSRFTRPIWVSVLVALALLSTYLVPPAPANADGSGGVTKSERIDSVDDGGFVVQVGDNTSVAEVLRDSEAPIPEAAVDLSGEAFNGAVLDIDRDEAIQLREDPRVVSVERNKIFTASSGATLRQLTTVLSANSHQQESFAGSSSTPWGLDRTDQRNLPLDSQYSPPSDGSGVHIYFVDSGIDLDHPDFGGRIGRSSYVESAGDSPDDCSGHGTHVAGTAASGSYGMATGAILHSVRVLDCNDQASLAAVLAGLNWVAANSDARSVVNLSLSGLKSTALNDTVSELVAAGTPVAVAAGNQARPACDFSPASAGPAIAVGALTKKDKAASFSNAGSCLDTYAPGISIESLAMGQPTETSTQSGTSMATPHVSGAIAVLWSQNPSLTGKEIGFHILNAATKGVVSFPSGQAGSPNSIVYVEPHDPNAPNTLLTSGTMGTVDSRNARFSFASTSIGSTFECRLDSLPWRTCTSSKSYASLSNGKHTFRVLATDPGGNTDPTAAVQRFTTAKRVVVKLRTNSLQSRLIVNVNPNISDKNYKIKVKKRIDGNWKTKRVAWTKRTADMRTINMPKGKYRVRVPAQHDLLGATSKSVRLTR